MHVTVNGRVTDVAPPATVGDLLSVLGYNEGQVAVALNRACVGRRAYAQTSLADGDEIEILAPMAGG